MRRTIAALAAGGALLGGAHLAVQADPGVPASEEAGIILMRGINNGQIGTWMITDHGQIFFPD